MPPRETRRFPLREAYAFAEEHGLADAVNEIRNLEIEWDRPYTSSVRRGRIIELFERRGLLEAFFDAHWPTGRTRPGEIECRQCRKRATEFAEYLEGISDPDDVTETPEEAALQFAVETHLRDFLAKNLDRVEPGLRLYTQDGISGVEFPVEAGRVDILAIDKRGKYVVLELKLSQGRNKTLGQLLYYMGWIDKNLGKPPCRGIIIAAEISDELATAVARAPGVSLARYRMTFAIDPVNASAV